MKNDHWLTDEARQALNAWEKIHQSWWESEQADPREIRGDLEAHLWHSRENIEEPVTLTQVKIALDQMALPGLEAPQNPLPKPTPSRGFFKRCAATLVQPFFLGIWPLLIVLWEISNGMLASMFFDPFSRLPQIILILTFSILGLFNFFRTFENQPPLWLTFLRGAGLIVAGYWGILLLPVIIIGTVLYGTGVLYTIGIGLIAFPLYLLCIMVAAAPILLAFGFLKRSRPASHRIPWFLGMLLGLGLLIIVEGPAYATRIGVIQNNPALIRSLGSEKTLLTMCYEGSAGRRRFTDTSGFLPGLLKFDLFNGESLSEGDRKKRRELYYRVTGNAFNSEEPPTTQFLSRNARASRGVTFDQDLVLRPF